jgi:hypothetical protein
MLSHHAIEKAVKDNIISQEQAVSLLKLGQPEPLSDTPDEQLRLIGGGNDIFVSVGIVLFLSGILLILGSIMSANQNLIAWLLILATLFTAQIVTKQKRMRLSSTILALFFVFFVGQIISKFAYNFIDTDAVFSNLDRLLKIRAVASWVSLLSGLTFLSSIGLYFWRFRVPILAAIAAATLTFLVWFQAVLFLFNHKVANGYLPNISQVPNTFRLSLFVCIICGLLIFSAAVTLDLHDRERRTVWSDCAFWLHVVSAPLLVHPLFLMATGFFFWGQEIIIPGHDAVIGLVVLIIFFTYVSIIIDRRSLLVPTLTYFGGLGIVNLVTSTADQAGIPPIAIVLLIIGTVVIFFGAGWQTIRKIVVTNTLPLKIMNKLPPITFS